MFPQRCGGRSAARRSRAFRRSAAWPRFEDRLNEIGATKSVIGPLELRSGSDQARHGLAEAPACRGAAAPGGSVGYTPTGCALHSIPRVANCAGW